MEFKSVGIIGYGRFGQVLSALLKDRFEVRVFDLSQNRQDEAGDFFKPLEEVIRSDALFYAVPISRLKETIESHVPLLSQYPPLVIFDVLSVKVHAKKIFDELLPPGIEAGLTHPLFGPDSIHNPTLPIVIDRYRLADATFTYWSTIFREKGLTVIEMSADDHDRSMALSQGLTHVIGRILGEMETTPSPIDTAGATKLHEIRNQVCNDTWELFTDLQQYNPYTLPMRVALGNAQQKIYNSLLPDRIDKETLVVGIQGGRGSFNEEAALYYLNRSGIKNFRLAYLHTTERVLQALHEGAVDRGQFAIHNSLGGVVTESIDAMAKYLFDIIEEFSIKISHALMTRKDVSLSEITQIMTHPQVLRQCTATLSKKYSKLHTISGDGDLVDHAKVAELLSQGKLAPSIATMGSKRLAEMYHLNIVEDNLQDLNDNFTSFLWVKRPSA